MKKLFSKGLWGALTAVFAVFFAAMMALTYVAENLAFAAVNMMFGTSTMERVDDPNVEPSYFFTTKYDFDINGNNLYQEDTAMIEEAVGAGAVLMWNKADALPLKGDEAVSTFGHASVNIVECGSGSGYVQTFDYLANKDVTTTLKDALESRGFEVNGTLWNLYATGAASSYKMTDPQTICTKYRQWSVNEAPWSIVNQANASFAQYDDVAIVTLARAGGEASDLHYNYQDHTDHVGNNDKGTMENTTANGGFLGLTDEEDQLLTEVTALKESGTFKKVVLLLNTGNTLQMADINEYYDGIDACMWIGQPGSTGINAVVDLLKGKDMQGNVLTPSGHLPDTWVYNLNSAPASMNDGNYTYGNSNLLTGGNLGPAHTVEHYMVYQEGIYIGYRYYETRYADLAEGNGNASSANGARNSAGAWNYQEEVAFPFGYGVSYTEFEYSNFSVEKNEKDEYVASVDVKNVGDVAGKEAVQIYLQKPYTDYDKEVGIEKSGIELAGFTKSDLLQPGQSKTYTVAIPEESLKCYDANEEMTYILEAGDYYFTVASDAHAALNNILDSAQESESYMGGVARTAQNVGNSVVKFTYTSTDTNTYSVSTQTGFEVTNALDEGDINKYRNKGDNAVTYLSRSDWAGTYPMEAAKLSLNRNMVNDLRFDNIPDPSASEYEMPEYEAANGRVAYEFIEAPLYPEKDEGHEDEVIDGMTYTEYWTMMWDELLDQMSLEEQCNIVTNAYHWVQGAESIALPETKQENGPVGITKRQEAFFSLPNGDKIKEEGTGWIWVAYPCAGLLAASFDADIAKRVGEHKSEDMLYLGYNGIYGPGVNMHRSPYGGRAFEYPSEDPLLAGKVEAAEALGIESQGCMAYAKHYALNDQETNRENCGVWSNEQASREIYLRPFEIVFTEGKASATMNSFTRIGTRWNGGCYEMMTIILREEWGYDGLAISDWVTENTAMSYVDGVLAGTDTFDGNGKAESLMKHVEGNPDLAQAVRTSAKRVIYNIVRTNAMNGTSIATRYVKVTPWWQQTLHICNYAFGGIAGLSALMFVLSIPLGGKKTKKAKKVK